MKVSCGIDFGTSNTSAGIARDNAIRLVALEDSHDTIPSAMFFQLHLTPVFGRQAQEYFLAGKEGRFMRSLKRVLGTPLMQHGTIINGKLWRFDKIIATFLKHIRDSIALDQGEPIDDVVIGRPVHFIDKNPAADKQAESELRAIAQAVGFKHIEFQFEPIAAAFAHETTLANETLALVADIGGGTSDFTIIRLSQKLVSKVDRSSDILATTGIRIGGNDFDKELCLTSFMPEFGYKSHYGPKHLEVPLKYYHDLAEWSKVNFLYTPKILSQVRQLYNESHDRVRFGRLITLLEQEYGHTVLAATEQAKIALTDQDQYMAPLSFVDEGLSIAIKRSKFENAISQNVFAVGECARECLRLSGAKADDIQLVILTGGSTEIPLLQQNIKNIFPYAAVADENKLSSVGLGLAFDSLRRFR